MERMANTTSLEEEDSEQKIRGTSKDIRGLLLEKAHRYAPTKTAEWC